MANPRVQTKEIPVYLFTGFLDSGKTTFIQGTMEDPGFNAGEKTLILLCEEGEEELHPVKFAASNVKIVTIEEEDELKENYLSALEAENHIDRVIVEYNGMWMLDTFYREMPANWTVYQEMSMVDARTYLSYNSNMRQLVYDKLKSVESVVFKHFTRAMDKMPFHKIVRQANRRCDIIYEYGEDDIEIDQIVDPLPFDLNADVVEIADQDYALWYSDISDPQNEAKYYGKTLKYKGRTLVDPSLKLNEFVFGRHVMQCCANDIQFAGLLAIWDKAQTLQHGGWAIMTAECRKEYAEVYNGEGPVFHVKELTLCDAPEEEVATFY